MNITKTLFATSMILAFSAPAFAADGQAINNRVVKQDARIEQGVNSGALTGKEAGNLEKHETKIGNDAAKAEADGKVTKPEARKLTREENRQSKRIVAKKHNGRTDATTATPIVAK